jgi:hypothetical protein
VPTPSELARNLIAAFERRDWQRLQSLYHPDARLPTEIGQREPLTPAELIALLRDAADDAVYDFDIASLIDLDERTALGSGSLRMRRPTGGFGDGPRHWLYVFRDDLQWRSGVYTSAAKARKAFTTQGHTLGVDESKRDVREGAPPRDARKSSAPAER